MPHRRLRALSTAALCAAACARRTPDATTESGASTSGTPAAVGDTVRVVRGQSALVDGGRLTITFDSASDSRCPRGTQCVWAGDAAVSLRLAAGASSAAATLHSALEPKRATLTAYDLVLLDLTPYPGTEPPNARLAQVAVLLVTRR